MPRSRYLLFQKAEAALIDEKADKLFGIARLLDNHLAHGFGEVAAQAVPAPQTRQEKVKALNTALSPFTDSVASSYQGVGAGYYSRDLRAILTYGPSDEFGSKVGIDVGPDHMGWQAMETGKEIMAVGSMVRGEIMNCVRPLVRNGKAIGFVWANETLAHVYGQINMGARKVFFSQDVEPLLGLTGLLLFSSRLLMTDRSLDEFARYLRLFLNSLSLGVILAGPDQTIVFASLGTEDILGRDPSMLTGRDLRRTLQGSGIDPVLALDDPRNGARNRWATLTMPWRVRTRHITMFSTEIETVGGTGTLLILEDLEEARQQEERLHKAESLAVLGELAASIAHEIRNPLTVVMGAASLLPERLTDKSFLTTFSQVALKELCRVNQTVESLLNFARFAHPRAAPLNVAAAVRRAAAVIEGYASLNNVKVEVRCQEPLPLVQGDMDHLVQAFLNLMLNAVQAMQGGGTLSIHVARDQSKHVQVSIKDTGPGIPKDVEDKVFNIFFTTKKDGTGLGLPLVQRIIDEQGGLISFKTQEGAGTTFTVDLPAMETKREESLRATDTCSRR